MSNQSIKSYQKAMASTLDRGDVIASYWWFKVVMFGKKRRYNEVD
jgi:hypothetical protein